MRALIDPGNLFSTLISEELASKLNLQVQGRHRRVGTAEAGGEVVILGQAKGLRIVLEGGLEPIVIDPHVVRRLAHPLNLGQDFLRQHGCKMEFSDQNVSLMIGLDYSVTEVCSMTGENKLVLTVDNTKLGLLTILKLTTTLM